MHPGPVGPQPQRVFLPFPWWPSVDQGRPLLLSTLGGDNKSQVPGSSPMTVKRFNCKEAKKRIGAKYLGALPPDLNLSFFELPNLKHSKKPEQGTCPVRTTRSTQRKVQTSIQHSPAPLSAVGLTDHLLWVQRQMPQGNVHARVLVWFSSRVG